MKSLLPVAVVIALGITRGLKRWSGALEKVALARQGLQVVRGFVEAVARIGGSDAVGRAAAKLGYSHMPAVSGAGHDAVYMAKLAPSGMIFIPCKDGISHNEIEDAKPEHIEAGCNVLLHAMLERALV